MTVFCCENLRKGKAGNATKKKRLNKDEIKEQLLSSLIGSKKFCVKDCRGDFSDFS